MTPSAVLQRPFVELESLNLSVLLHGDNVTNDDIALVHAALDRHYDSLDRAVAKLPVLRKYSRPQTTAFTNLRLHSGPASLSVMGTARRGVGEQFVHDNLKDLLEHTKTTLIKQGAVQPDAV